jgi:hypothetical protein
MDTQLLFKQAQEGVISVDLSLTLTDLNQQLISQGYILPLSTFTPESTLREILTHWPVTTLEFAWGRIFENLVALELSTSNNKTIKTGAPVVKSVAGYNLHHYLLGRSPQETDPYYTLTTGSFKVYSQQPYQQTITTTTNLTDALTLTRQQIQQLTPVQQQGFELTNVSSTHYQLTLFTGYQSTSVFKSNYKNAWRIDFERQSQLIEFLKTIVDFNDTLFEWNDWSGLTLYFNNGSVETLCLVISQLHGRIRSLYGEYQPITSTDFDRFLTMLK